MYIYIYVTLPEDFFSQYFVIVVILRSGYTEDSLLHSVTLIVTVE
jgi:hypothetical protein